MLRHCSGCGGRHPSIAHGGRPPSMRGERMSGLDVREALQLLGPHVLAVVVKLIVLMLRGGQAACVFVIVPESLSQGKEFLGQPLGGACPHCGCLNPACASSGGRDSVKVGLSCGGRVSVKAWGGRPGRATTGDAIVGTVGVVLLGHFVMHYVFAMAGLLLARTCVVLLAGLLLADRKIGRALARRCIPPPPPPRALPGVLADCCLDGIRMCMHLRLGG